MSNCERIEGTSYNVPYRSYVGQDWTDFRNSNDVVRDLKSVLSQNGCESHNSYAFKLCLQRNADVAKQFLDQRFQGTYSPNVCKNNNN
jgi:hypothetical protein